EGRSLCEHGKTSGVTLMARHREPSLPNPHNGLVRLCQRTPANMLACDHGRRQVSWLAGPYPPSPSRDQSSQWHVDGGFTAYSCGGSCGLGRAITLTAFPLSSQIGSRPLNGRESHKIASITKKSADQLSSVSLLFEHRLDQDDEVNWLKTSQRDVVFFGEIGATRLASARVAHQWRLEATLLRSGSIRCCGDKGVTLCWSQACAHRGAA